MCVVPLLQFVYDLIISLIDPDKSFSALYLVDHFFISIFFLNKLQCLPNSRLNPLSERDRQIDSEICQHRKRADRKIWVVRITDIGCWCPVDLIRLFFSNNYRNRVDQDITDRFFFCLCFIISSCKLLISLIQLGFSFVQKFFAFVKLCLALIQLGFGSIYFSFCFLQLPDIFGRFTLCHLQKSPAFVQLRFQGNQFIFTIFYFLLGCFQQLFALVQFIPAVLQLLLSLVDLCLHAAANAFLTFFRQFFI